MENAGSHLTTRQRHVVMDIGGTWFRAALREPDGTLCGLLRQPAVNYLNHPHLSPPELRAELVRYVLREVARLAPDDRGGGLRVSLAVGAAVNGHTGEILDSGPLWGPASGPFDLAGALAAARGDAEWSIVNDVTALAAYFARRPQYRGCRRMAALTVSTGIALRTIEVATGRVPVHPRRGVQGEIGHVPVAFRPAGTELSLRCDCGGRSHLNAFCSGRGVPRVMWHLAQVLGRPGWRTPAILQDPGHWATTLRRGLIDRDPAARTLLDAVVEPVAQFIITLLAVDPEIERIVVTGGVPRSLGQAYHDTLLESLDARGVYMVSETEPDFFRNVIDFADSAGDAGLHGAAIAAESFGPVAVAGAAPPATPPVPRPSTLVTHGRRRTRPRLDLCFDTVITDGGAGAALAEALRTGDGGTRPVLLVDDPVAAAHGPALVSRLRDDGYDPILRALPAGEPLKTWAALDTILGVFEAIGVSRRQHPVVAVGGGALLDAVGLAAGLYRRGVPYLRVPTSLVGLIDAGVGAKVGINRFGHKNRLGLFHPPRAVVLDVAFLATLPHRFLVSGVAELLKIAVVGDKVLFDLIETHAAHLVDPAFYRTDRGVRVLARAADAMMSSLQENLWEQDLERSVDFGHSVSQVFETMGHSTVTHGDAVAVDMALFLEIGRARSVTRPDDADRILRLVKGAGLPTYIDTVTARDVVRALDETTRHRGGRQRLPLIRTVGERPVFVDDVGAGELTAAWSRLSLDGHRTRRTAK